MVSCQADQRVCDETRSFEASKGVFYIENATVTGTTTITAFTTTTTTYNITPTTTTTTTKRVK